MTEPTRAKLIPVTGTNDKPDMNNALDCQFNPATLKVALANTLKAGKRAGNKRAAQYVDKSSSNLSVELIFDTTLEGTDVRQKTKRIAETFMKPIASGKKMKAPSRCRFQWGAFEFIGLMQSFDETLDFFSPEGTPLRATVSLKLSEDRFQFLTRQAAKAKRETPTLTSTGGGPAEDGGPPGGEEKPVNDATRDAGQDDKAWRDTALYNGVESPRFPDAPVLAVPQASAANKLSASASIKLATGVGAPGFKFGASASLGTNVAGAFSSVGNGLRGASAAGVLAGVGSPSVSVRLPSISQRGTRSTSGSS